MKSLTQCHEIFQLSRLLPCYRSLVQQKAVGDLGDKLQGDAALKARLERREPGVTVASEAVFCLLAVWPVEIRRAFASIEKKNYEKKISTMQAELAKGLSHSRTLHSDHRSL